MVGAIEIKELTRRKFAVFCLLPFQTGRWFSPKQVAALRRNFVAESVAWKDIRVIHEDQEECHRLLSKFNPADKARLRWQVICLTGDMKLAPRFASLAWSSQLPTDLLTCIFPLFLLNLCQMLKTCWNPLLFNQGSHQGNGAKRLIGEVATWLLASTSTTQDRDLNRNNDDWVSRRSLIFDRILDFQLVGNANCQRF